MSKFRLNANSVFTIGGNAIPCPVSVTIDENVDDYTSDCPAQTVKAHVLGVKNVTGSFSGELEHDDIAEFAYIAPGTSGAMVLRPAGTTAGMWDITSTNMQISSRSFAASATGFTTYTCNFVLDDLSIAPISS